jgi:hypothetical protein
MEIFAVRGVTTNRVTGCYRVPGVSVRDGLMPDDDWIARVLSDPARDSRLLRAGMPVYPVVGYSTATISDIAALLQIEFLVPPPNEGTRVLPLVLRRPQCTELARALEQLAAHPHKASTTQD